MDFGFPLLVVLLGVGAFFAGQNQHISRAVRNIASGKDGCMPVEDVGNVTLHYFAGRGRAEPFRLLMDDAGIAWTQTKFNKETWPAAKEAGMKSGLYPFGQVPAIVTSSGVELAQTNAIIKYLARSAGLDCDCGDYTYCDMLLFGVEDVIPKIGKVVWDEEFSAEKRRAYLTDTASVWLGHFEKIAPAVDAPENKAFFASNRLTWVDFCVYNLIDYHLALANHDLGDETIDIMKGSPKLAAFHRRMSQRPRIAAYLTSDRRAPFSLPYPPKK